MIGYARKPIECFFEGIKTKETKKEVQRILMSQCVNILMKKR